MVRSMIVIAALAAAAVVASGVAGARGLGEAGEVEAARANARAGGPVSERDAELLERYGCLSGTESKFCKRLARRDNAYRRKHKYE